MHSLIASSILKPERARSARGNARAYGLNARRRGARSGLQVLEMLLVLPIVLIVLLAFFQFGPLVLVQQTVTNAAEETSREITKICEFDISDPDDLAKAEDVVNTVLRAGHDLSTGSPGVLVVIENSDGVACLGDASLEPDFCPMTSSITDAAETRVTIILRIEDAPVPQVLQTFCIDFSDRYFQVSSLTRKDCPPTT